MSYYTLSVNWINHDSSVCLFEDDRLIYFVQSERFSRKKHDWDIDPKCFDYIYSNITKIIDLLVLLPYGNINEYDILFKTITDKFQCKRIIDREQFKIDNKISHDLEEIQTCWSHHCTHALSAFYLSPFDEAVCLIIDAMGSSYFLGDDRIKIAKFGDTNGIFGTENCSILELSKNYNKKYLYKRSQCAPFIMDNATSRTRFAFGAGLQEHDKNRFNKFPYKFDASWHLDIGGMYVSVSQHLGFGTNGAGKVMGLSAYGSENKNIPPMLVENTILGNNNLFTLSRQIDSQIYPELFEEMTFELGADLAYAVQKALEKNFLARAEFILENSKMRNLVIGGGCALNILGISLIKQTYPEFNIFVDPIANDATHSIGLGINYYNQIRMNGRLEKKSHFNSIYLGPKYDENEMRTKIDDFLFDSFTENLIGNISF